MRDIFFDISNEKIFSNNFDSVLIFFLWCKNARLKIITLDAITPPDHTPVSNGSGVTDSISGIRVVSDARISAGKITDMKLISTIDMENKKTIQGIDLLFELFFASNFFNEQSF